MRYTKADVIALVDETPGLWVQTHSPGDGTVRYRFTHAFARGYFQDCESELHYTAGAGSAIVYVRGFRHGTQHGVATDA